MGKNFWSKEEECELEEMYKNGLSFKEMSEKLNRTITSVQYKSSKLKLGEKYMRSNNPNFKASYQDYDWCFDRYINKGMTHKEMADECGATKRVIEKWCSQIHGINNHTFRKLKKLKDMQRQIIMFGVLGDGHIDKRETQPMYIESHAENQKDYLFWKYEILKDLCNNKPVYYKETETNFGENKIYKCKPTYRLNTKILDDLYEIRNMTNIDILNELNEFGFCLHVLDDGYRGGHWQICLAEWTQEEICFYINKVRSLFGFTCKQNKDCRYVDFDANSSRKIDEMILRNIPNELDIVQYKIINNGKITSAANYNYIVKDGNVVGLNSYCRKNGIPYKKGKKVYDSFNLGNEITELDEDKFLEKLKVA